MKQERLTRKKRAVIIAAVLRTKWHQTPDCGTIYAIIELFAGNAGERSEICWLQQLTYKS
jgi:hypothetical protein